MQTRLKARTLELVRECVLKREGRKLAAATGVDYLTIWRFAHNKTDKLDAEACQTLYEHLSGNALVLTEHVQ